MYEMDHKDKEILREVLVKWYGPQANGWEMNSAVLRMVLKMVGDTELYLSHASGSYAYDVWKSIYAVGQRIFDKDTRGFAR